jgi:hypothetical protein
VGELQSRRRRQVRGRGQIAGWIDPPLKTKWFQIQIAERSRFILSRDGENWTQEFPSMAEAIAYAGTLPEATGSVIAIMDGHGTLIVQAII